MAIRPCLSSLAIATRQRREAVPLLNCQRLIFWQIESYLLALCIEGIKINVCNNTQRAVGRGLSEVRQIFVREFRFSSKSTAASRHWGGRLEGL